MRRPRLEAEALAVQQGARPVRHVPALQVEPGEILAVIGPNGAGKSTLLRVLALLDAPSRGVVRIGGAAPRTEAERLAWRRRMACVFQEPLLCRGTVLYNARLACRLRGLPPAAAERRARDWLDRLGIASLAGRAVETLSGGEAQRTSLARAFAAEPEVLCLDEPFAALDPPTRDALLADLGQLLGATRPTTVLVTHDRSEALRLGDRVAVLLDGRVAQVGPPETVFGAPAGEAVARFVGVENLLPGRVLTVQDGLAQVRVQVATLVVSGTAPAGAAVLVGLRPEDLTLGLLPGPGRSSAQNRLSGQVTAVTALGAVYRVALDCGVPLTALVTRPAVLSLGLAPGVVVAVSFKATAAHLVPRETAPSTGGPAGVSAWRGDA